MAETEKHAAENDTVDHEFDPGHTGMSEACNRLVLRAGYGDDCGLPREHPIHRTSWCCENDAVWVD